MVLELGMLSVPRSTFRTACEQTHAPKFVCFASGLAYSPLPTATLQPEDQQSAYILVWCGCSKRTFVGTHMYTHVLTLFRFSVHHAHLHLQPYLHLPSCERITKKPSNVLNLFPVLPGCLHKPPHLILNGLGKMLLFQSEPLIFERHFTSKPSDRKHCLCASMNALHFSSPFMAMHSSRAASRNKQWGRELHDVAWTWAPGRSIFVKVHRTMRRNVECTGAALSCTVY